MAKLKLWAQKEWHDYKVLMRDVPVLVVVLFCVSVILMNLLANREFNLGINWLALDCGFLVSWMSFLFMDMLTKRYGAKASIKISLTATAMNLIVCAVFYIVMKFPGNWGEFYTYGINEVNYALDKTFGGTWYVLLGSTTAFVVAAVVNATINVSIGKLLKVDNFRAFALRSYVSTLIAQFVDNMIFALMVSYVFFGWSMLQVITCSITGCLMELIAETIFSPIGYVACKRWDKAGVGTTYIDTVLKKAN